MENVQIIETEINGNIEVTVLIDRGNGEFTSMPKAVYDAQVEHLTEMIPADEAKTK